MLEESMTATIAKPDILTEEAAARFVGVTVATIRRATFDRDLRPADGGFARAELERFKAARTGPGGALLLTFAEGATYLDVAYGVITNAVIDGALVPVKAGRRQYIALPDLLELQGSRDLNGVGIRRCETCGRPLPKEAQADVNRCRHCGAFLPHDLTNVRGGVSDMPSG
jgi:hypothetical protein